MNSKSLIRKDVKETANSAFRCYQGTWVGALRKPVK